MGVCCRGPCGRGPDLRQGDGGVEFTSFRRRSESRGAVVEALTFVRATGEGQGDEEIVRATRYHVIPTQVGI